MNYLYFSLVARIFLFISNAISAQIIAEGIVKEAGSGKELKEKVLGNTTESRNVTAGFTSNKLGNEVGIIIKIKKAPTFIKSFTASVVSKDNKPV